MVKCGKCGMTMRFCKTLETDWNLQDMEIMVTEKWECLECEIEEILEIKGNITEIYR